MIECGCCANELAGLARVVKRVTIKTPEAQEIPAYELCKLAAKTSRQLAEDLFRTFQAMHHRPPGVIRLKAFKGYTFEVSAEEIPVHQPRMFDGTPGQAEAAGWEITPSGWICPTCRPEAHRPEDSEAGFGGLENFFEETKDL